MNTLKYISGLSGFSIVLGYVLIAIFLSLISGAIAKNKGVDENTAKLFGWWIALWPMLIIIMIPVIFGELASFSWRNIENGKSL